MAPVYDGKERAPMPFRARRGSSLVEMLTAVVILAFVLMAMGSMFLLSQTVTYAKEDETASSIALRFMEEQEGRPFEDFNSAVKPGLFPCIEHFGNGKYKATAYVVSLDDFSASLRVTVEWSPVAGGRRKEVTLNRIISSGGYKNVGKL
jgi:Tfp pilus assembly protein PilV